MKRYECDQCEEVMEITCTEAIENCPCCGANYSLSKTEKTLSPTVMTTHMLTHEVERYEGCGASYTVTSDAPVEFCPNCGGQWG